MTGRTLDLIIAEWRRTVLVPDGAEATVRKLVADGHMTETGLARLVSALRRDDYGRRTSFERAELEALIANGRSTRRLTPGLVRLLRASFATRLIATIEDAEMWVAKWPRGFADTGSCPIGKAPTCFCGKTWGRMTPAERDELTAQFPDLAEVMFQEGAN